MIKLRALFAIICMLICAGTAYAQDAQQWNASGGWKVRYNASPEYWRLYHNDSAWKDTISVLWADRRENISLAQAFEEVKAMRAELDSCPGLLTAETKAEYEPYAKAMLALTKIKDPEAYAEMDKDIPIIGYEAVDDTAKPRCVLIAREFAGGAMLYALIKEDTDRLSTQLGTIRLAVHDLMDDINKREAPMASDTQSASAASAKDVPVQCDGKLFFEDWVVSSSPKSAIVYVRNPIFVDSEKRSADQFRLGVNIGGKIDATRGREEIYYSIMIAARENGQNTIPEKRTLSVDGEVVQEWGKGGGQWKTLSDNAMNALYSGHSAELDTLEMGRIRFDLSGLETYLKRADIAQQKAVIHKALGTCTQ
ncbi:hypothetical protein [Parvularcula marina]|uniref:Uncharacterized protein n=1 Tax=Parvularcula marina TaxID=2292771 RepID=A0A371RFR9_9PROT|nr:hypothetical protein [Parvularcula marina]RFB04298.1 hypothetical protein DX908_02770 [Parvularcula marina]